MEPVKFGKDVLSHADLSFSMDVYEWIMANTKQPLESDLKNLTNSKFYTRRNSKATALKWRRTITLENALEIQKGCQSEMQRLRKGPKCFLKIYMAYDSYDMKTSEDLANHRRQNILL